MPSAARESAPELSGMPLLKGDGELEVIRRKHACSAPLAERRAAIVSSSIYFPPVV
jgi:hypothetical protein